MHDEILRAFGTAGDRERERESEQLLLGDLLGSKAPYGISVQAGPSPSTDFSALSASLAV